MAERSTAAVDVAGNSGGKPLTAKAGKATADGAEAAIKAGTHKDSGRADGKKPARDARTTPELHSGHKLARRYRLEECVTRLEGFSSWRAVDEKLRRAVGVHLLPADHPRARPVLAAARSAALLGDPRFVQVLDAVEENDLVYVVHEWLPDATELTNVLASGPMEPHDAYQLVSQVSQAMAAAHREGLAHLRLHPGSVLRTGTGQYRIRGLAVMAALRGITSDRPQQTDTEAIGALLYAALTQRWPYEDSAHGLPGLPKGVGLIAPDQVRAGVHRGLSELAMRALVHDGSTSSRQEKPCTTPEELSKAVAAMPRIRPPEPSFTTPPGGYPRPHAYGQQPPHGGAATGPLPGPPPPPLQGRTGRALKWSVAALLIAALGLASWQLADTLLKDGQEDRPQISESTGDDGSKPTGKPIEIHDAEEYAPNGNAQSPERVKNTYTKYDSPDQVWRSRTYNDGPSLAQYKGGVGIVYDLGKKQQLSSADIKFLYGGHYTEVSLYAAKSLSGTAPLGSMKKLTTEKTETDSIKLSLKEPVKTQYVVLWITAAPHSGPDATTYAGDGYKQGITKVKFAG
ncbi:serine/threonine protein kinase [Streptomyces rectiverticillatus]|uniref:protein kinase family protein n=1 Tax=Streptomyces rectiverticillatus TaxID=173860 RepID=UPI0015C351E6|nr:protein kinase family protein [Streptomyces rectiverticillatus]QLE73006.1 serine/threonine protein kinase [Streptomyces rectiverticillatus]